MAQEPLQVQVRHRPQQPPARLRRGRPQPQLWIPLGRRLHHPRPRRHPAPMPGDLPGSQTLLRARVEERAGLCERAETLDRGKWVTRFVFLSSPGGKMRILFPQFRIPRNFPFSGIRAEALERIRSRIKQCPQRSQVYLTLDSSI